MKMSRPNTTVPCAVRSWDRNLLCPQPWVVEEVTSSPPSMSCTRRFFFDGHQGTRSWGQNATNCGNLWCSTPSQKGGQDFFEILRHTLWWTYKKQWKMAIEIVDFPLKMEILRHTQIKVLMFFFWIWINHDNPHRQTKSHNGQDFRIVFTAWRHQEGVVDQEKRQLCAISMDRTCSFLLGLQVFTEIFSCSSAFKTVTAQQKQWDIWGSNRWILWMFDLS